MEQLAQGHNTTQSDALGLAHSAEVSFGVVFSSVIRYNPHGPLRGRHHPCVEMEFTACPEGQTQIQTAAKIVQMDTAGKDTLIAEFRFYPVRC